MNFKKLPKDIQEKIYVELITSALNMGGKNFFLKMVESIKDEEFPPLLDKGRVFSFPNAKLLWNKIIYKDTFELILKSMKKEDKDGDILSGLEPKEYRAVMNMLRTLKPINLTVKPKKVENGTGFTFSILDTTEDRKTKFSPLFKTIFLYHISYAKEVLNFRPDNIDLEDLQNLAENQPKDKVEEVVEVKLKKVKKRRTKDYRPYISKKDREV